MKENTGRLNHHLPANTSTSFSPPLNPRDARVLFYEVVSEVIVPRLEALGLEASKAWELRHGRAMPSRH
jgi:hypothetical protein